MQIKQLSTSPQVLHGLSGCCVAVFTVGSRYFPSRSIQIDVTQFFLIANQFAVCSTLIAGASCFLVPIRSKAMIYMLLQLLKLTTTIILVQWVRSIASQFLAIGPSNPKVKMVSFWGITVYRESEICVFALGVSCLQHCIQYFRSTRGSGDNVHQRPGIQESSWEGMERNASLVFFSNGAHECPWAHGSTFCLAKFSQFNPITRGSGRCFWYRTVNSQNSPAARLAAKAPNLSGRMVVSWGRSP